MEPAPFSHEKRAICERDNIDYGIKISLKDAREGKVRRKIRVYADGIYDLFHSGHAKQLMQAKAMFPSVYLIVGVCSDALTRQRKGRTVMDESERYEALRHCRYVDEVVPDAPWTISQGFLEYHKIDFVAHDDIPYTTGSDGDVYALLKERGMFLTTNRTDGISTSDVVSRIVKDYDLYARRSLDRGYTTRDLNVSFLKAKKYQLQDKISDLKRRGMRVIDGIEEKRSDLISKWEEKSREFIEAFLLLFGRDGRLSKYIFEKKESVMHIISPQLLPFEHWNPSSNNRRSGNKRSKVKRNRWSGMPISNRRFLYLEGGENRQNRNIKSKYQTIQL